MNPLLATRERLGFTQQEVATHTGTSQQYIQRLESGQINSCPPLIAAFYDSHTGENITQQYKEWVRQTRQELRDLSRFFTMEATRASEKGMPYISGSQMFNDLCILLEIEPRSNSAERLMAEKLHIHPVIVSRWRATGGMPPTLVHALKETAR